MKPSLREMVDSYDAGAPLAEAATIPAFWYVDERIAELERKTVFSRSWIAFARTDQLAAPGEFVTGEVAGEPVVVVRGQDQVLRAFYNVCRHHAAAVMTQECGKAQVLRCPYHGWTYALDGALRGATDFADVQHFDRAKNGLVPLQVATWEPWVFVKLDAGGPTLHEFLGEDLLAQGRELGWSSLRFFERRRYTIECNWKVFVDNYLDGGYHVPHLHHTLDSVLDYTNYTIENGARHCLQSSPLMTSRADEQTVQVRRGTRASYYWVYPNFMINHYQGVMDTNLVVPRGIDRMDVIFDFYFADVSDAARERNLKSITLGQSIQAEDHDICKSVQRGLTSRAYVAGRLSVRREKGEHLYHRLLHADLLSGL
jgi:choline monooxygenase